MFISIPMLEYKRPVIDIMGHPALIDTGAVIPMTNFSPEVLEILYNAKLQIRDKEIGGIGGKTKGDVYALYNFKIGVITYEKLDVFVPKNRDFRFAFLLSATMFHGTKYSFDTLNENNKHFNVEINKESLLHRTFEIKDLQGQLCAQIDGVLLQDDYDIQDRSLY